MRSWPTSSPLRFSLKKWVLYDQFNYSQTSLIRTPKGQSQVSALQRCSYYRGRKCTVRFLAFLGPNELSVVEKCPYYRDVRKERLDCTARFILHKLL